MIRELAKNKKVILFSGGSLLLLLIGVWIGTCAGAAGDAEPQGTGADRFQDTERSRQQLDIEVSGLRRGVNLLLLLVLVAIALAAVTLHQTRSIRRKMDSLMPPPADGDQPEPSKPEPEPGAVPPPPGPPPPVPPPPKPPPGPTLPISPAWKPSVREPQPPPEEAVPPTDEPIEYVTLIRKQKPQIERSPRRPEPPSTTERYSPRAAEQLRRITQSLSTTPHGDVGLLLLELHRDAPQLAEKFSDPKKREQFLADFDEPLMARLQRFVTAMEQGREVVRERWLEPDLIATLNALARYQSDAIMDAFRHRPARSLAEELGQLLYERFAEVCLREGWFEIVPVSPYATDFDGDLHRALDGREVGHDWRGKVLFVHSIGRRDPEHGGIIHKAEVTMGR